MPGDTSALVTLWDSLPSGNTNAQNLSIIQSTMVAGPNRDVPVGEVVGYLMQNGKLFQLSSYVTAASGAPLALASAHMLMMIATNQTVISTFQMSNPTAYTSISNMLDAVSSDANSGITSGDAASIMAMCATTQGWWAANGFASNINGWDLFNAGILTHDEADAVESAMQT